VVKVDHSWCMLIAAPGWSAALHLAANMDHDDMESTLHYSASTVGRRQRQSADVRTATAALVRMTPAAAPAAAAEFRWLPPSVLP
jgi:hypothetical protein